jgi:putative membrane protein
MERGKIEVIGRTGHGFQLALDRRYHCEILAHPRMANRSTSALIPLICVVVGVFIGSAIAPRDRFTWWLEIFPALLGAAILTVTYRRFRFATLVYTLIAVHMIILLVGERYTYAQVPLFNWLRDRLHLARNDYDRLGHFAQGFVPAMIAREVLVRNSVVRRGFWLVAIVISICLAISASYELFEWLVAMLSGSSADAFLGTQGDPWDTQEDMATCLAGAVLALFLLSNWQDRQMARNSGNS